MTATESADPSVEAPDGPTAPAGRLASGSVRFFSSVAVSIGIQAPTGGLVFLPALMAELVGESGPLAFLAAIVVMLPVAAVFGAFSRQFATAGSVYAFVGRTLSPVVGFVACLGLFLTYVSYTSATAAGAANAAAPLLADVGLHFNWLVPGLAAWALGWYLSFRPVHFTTVVVLTLEGVALVLVLIVGIVVIAKGGYQGHSVSLSPFRPHGIKLSAFVIGLVFAYTGFSGFEGAATLGEEANLPRRIIPLAVITSLLVGGGAYVFGSYVETISYPNATALSKSTVPMISIAHQYLTPWVGTAVNVAALISIFGAVLACATGGSRLLFALTRDGFVHRGLAATHPRHRSPYRALAVTEVLALAGMLIFAGDAPLDVFFYTAQYGVYLILSVYLLTCIAGLVYAFRRHRPPLMLTALAGVAVLGVVIKYSVVPIPAYPFDRLLVAAAVTLAGAVAVAALPSYRRRLMAAPTFRPDGTA